MSREYTIANAMQANKLIEKNLGPDIYKGLEALVRTGRIHPAQVPEMYAATFATIAMMFLDGKISIRKELPPNETDIIKSVKT